MNILQSRELTIVAQNQSNIALELTKLMCNKSLSRVRSKQEIQDIYFKNHDKLMKNFKKKYLIEVKNDTTN